MSFAVNVVASTPDLAAIAKEIGGDRVVVESLSRPNQDPHSFEILPQHVAAMRTAELYLRVGAGLDYWSDELLDAAGESRPTVIDCSAKISLIHDEAESVHEHAEHQAGNPHYWLGPSNVPIIAAQITAGLQQVDGDHAAEYASSLESFDARFNRAYGRWTAALAGCRGLKIVTYHRAWDYFARDFGLIVTGTIEPHPGVEPSAHDLVNLETRIRNGQAGLLFLEPYESDRLARLLERDTGVSVIVVPSSVGATGSANDIFSLFDSLTRDVQAHCTASQP